ncbi:MAG: FKBP-type peptidyl-prolyl cis-trans isomerase [Muribaculaceae bacterium]|nr:FKBP-type peptidyl-prolyl cis-trans isomerase [Muribaculaceae bacterium]MDE6755120.1 FKBP-type peptidyl-prolyl cis-trans isomerase [Muribaculaceae bacterium]
MKLLKFGLLALPLVLSLSSCLNNDDPDNSYSEWRAENEQYISSAEKSGKYSKITPDWDKTSFVLIDWVRKGDSTNKVVPLDNSTVDVVYMLTNVRGDTIDSSFRLTTNGDSIYRVQPCQTCTGFRIALTNMNIGDSVTAVMPYYAGYGALGSGSVLPFSTLIFQIKLVGIPGLEKLPQSN